MPPRRPPPRRTRSISARLPTDARTVKSAARALAIMECFDDQQRRLTVMEVARALDLPQSSASTLLASLTALGYLDYEPASRTYQPSIRVALMGAWVSADFLARGPVIALMEALGARTGETVLLAVRNGLYAQYIHVVQATKPGLPHLPLGGGRLLTQSGAGHALLSAMADVEAARLVRRINAGPAAGGVQLTEAELPGVLAQVRRQGYAFTHDLVAKGAAVIAAPLPRAEDRPSMVVGLGGRTEDLVPREAELARLLLEEIARALGPVTDRGPSAG